MEVHHHPKVEKKGFKEYFLEFIMIFLAVTMGFVAENVRESISESNKAREYAENLYQEVYQDSITMQSKLKTRLEKEDQAEYFRKYVRDSNLTELNDRFYKSFAWTFLVTSSIIFEPEDGVLNELKSSGAQRVFKNAALQKSISDITVTIAKLRNRNAQEYSFVEDYTRPFMLQFFDFAWQDALTQNGKLSFLNALENGSFHSDMIPKLKNLPEFKREHAESLAAYYLLLIRATRQQYYQDYLAKNHKLLEELRNTYHLKD
jgi:hypothetical protein